MKKVKEILIDFLKKSALLFLGWGLAPFLKIYSSFSKRKGWLKVVGTIPRGGSLLIVGNHETFGEPLEVTIEVWLADPLNFTNPIRYLPWTVQAEDNFLKYAFFLRAHLAIWVDRNNIISRTLALRKAKRILDAGGNIILFPGGMRDYHTIKEGSEVTEPLGELFDGAAWLVAHCKNIKVVPFGTKGYTGFMPNNKPPLPRVWARREIRIGKPLRFPPQSSLKEITADIRKAIVEQIQKR